MWRAHTRPGGEETGLQWLTRFPLCARHATGEHTGEETHRHTPDVCTDIQVNGHANR